MCRLTVAIFLDVKLEFDTVTVGMYISVRDAILMLAQEFILLASRRYVQNYFFKLVLIAIKCLNDMQSQTW